MRYLVSTVWMAAVLAFLFLFDITRFFAVGGIAPHLTLVFLFMLAVRRIPAVVFAGTLVGFLLLSFLFAPFWVEEMGIAAGVAVLGYILAHFLTGNQWFDMTLLAVGGTALFAVGIHFAGLGVVSWSAAWEGVYNALIGAILLAAFPRRLWPHYRYEKTNAARI